MAKKTRSDVTNKISEIETKVYPDTVAGKIESIEDNSKLVSYEVSYLGLGNDLNLAASAMAVASIINRGSIDATVREGESYTIIAGYYEGGTVKGVSGGGNYTLTTGTATPTEAQQIITPPSGYYGLSQVTVEPIPYNYKDVTGTNTTTAEDVLSGKYVTTTEGKIEGTMINNGTVNQTLIRTNSSYTIAKGYHSGSGKVIVSYETKTVTPTETEQIITGDNNKFLSQVTVEAIDKDTYLELWTADANSVDSNILIGKTAYVDGVKITGSMVDNTTWDTTSHTLNTTTTSISIPAGYHNGTGTVLITTQSKTATAPAPGVARQEIKPDNGKVLSSVIVPALDSKYQDVSGVTAVATHVCSGYKFVNADGTLVTGTLVDAGNKKNTNFYDDLMSSGSNGCTVLSGTEAHYTSVEASIDGTLYNRLASI